MTEPEPLQQLDRTYVRYRGRRFSYFSGCDYFRLSSHPPVLDAFREGLKKHGLNVAASRLTTGNHKLYVELEQCLAEFFRAEAALLLPNGYVTSLAAAQALAGMYSHAVVDGRAHPALLDAAQMLECPIFRFKHRDADDFARTLKRCGSGARPIVLTDGMFSQDGSAAPLKQYLKRLPRDGTILVDDAHGAGVLGKTGKGTPEHEAIDRRQLIQCITLSKAFGAFGGAILGSKSLRKTILQRSRMFVGSTPFPLPVAAAAIRSLRILKTDHSLRRRLFKNADLVKTALRKAGYELPETSGPIIRLPVEGAKNLRKLKRQLLAADIYPPFLKYPGGSANGYFRFVISSEHSRVQLTNLLNVLRDHISTS